MTAEVCRAELARHLKFYVEKLTDSGRTFKAAGVPPHLARHVLAADRGSRFPSLVGMIHAPTLLADGTLIVEHGYHAASGLWLDPLGLTTIAVPEHPSDGDIDVARRLIADDLLGDFPFANVASKANAIAFLITCAAFDSFEGLAPIFVVDANQMGTGKTFLVEVVHTVASGRTATATPPDRDEEFRKRITSDLIAGRTLLAIENLSGALKSPVLAQLATSPSWSDRVLGVSRTVDLDNRLVISATGNNVELAGDLARRCVFITLEAREHQAWQHQYRNPKLLGWVHNHRSELLGAILTLVRAWHAEGRPQPSDSPMLGSYQSWASTMAGVLDQAGIKGFLGNQHVVYDQADRDTSSWAGVLAATESQFPGWFTTADFTVWLKGHVQGEGAGGPDLPSNLAYAVDHHETQARLVRVGKQLAGIVGRRFDESGLRLERTRDGTTKSSRYRVIRDRPAMQRTISQEDRT